MERPLRSPGEGHLLGRPYQSTGLGWTADQRTKTFSRLLWRVAAILAVIDVALYAWVLALATLGAS